MSTDLGGELMKKCLFGVLFLAAVVLAQEIQLPAISTRRVRYIGQSSNPTCNAGDYFIWSNTTDLKLKKCQNGAITDLDAGGGAGDVEAVGDCGSGECFTASGTGTTLTFHGSGSGTQTVTVPSAASGAITIPAATDTLVGKATTDDLTNKTITIPILGFYTVGTLPAAGTAGRIAVVTDAATAGSCTSGSGSEISLCRDSGSAWVPLGDGGGGAPDPHATSHEDGGSDEVTIILDAQTASSCAVGRVFFAGASGIAACDGGIVWDNTAKNLEIVGATNSFFIAKAPVGGQAGFLMRDDAGNNKWLLGKQPTSDQLFLYNTDLTKDVFTISNSTGELSFNDTVKFGDYQDLFRISAPTNPASTELRVFANDATGKLACLDSTGADCMPDGGGAYAATMSSSTTWSIPGTTHALNTADLAVFCRTDNGTAYVWVEPDDFIINKSSYDVTITWATATAGRVLILKSGGQAASLGEDSVGTTELDDDANTPLAGDLVIVETGAASFDYVTPDVGTDFSADLEEETHADEHAGDGLTYSGDQLLVQAVDSTITVGGSGIDVGAGQIGTNELDETANYAWTTYHDYTEIAAPSNPGSGIARCYAKSGAGELCCRDNLGTEICMSAGGGGGGDNITVNTTAATDANFNDTLPAAPANTINVEWQIDTGATPDNVSANVPYGSGLTVTGGDLVVDTTVVQVRSEKNSASGYAGLDGSVKLALAQGQEVWGVADLSDFASKSGSGTAALGATISTPSDGQYPKYASGDWVNSTLGAAGTGSCTNQAVTALNGDSAPTCTTLTSSYVDTSIALATGSWTTSNLLSASAPQTVQDAGVSVQAAGSAGTSVTNAGTATTLARSDHEHRTVWRVGMVQEATPTASTTSSVVLPTATLCGGSIDIGSITVATVNQGTGALTFNVARYQASGSLVGNLFLSDQSYSNVGNPLQQFTPNQNQTGTNATDYYRVVWGSSVNGQTFISAVVEGKCKNIN